ncbi:ABC transporter ATP-binding protein [Candidatus Chlorohelix sp.]|uniref:ABC transporter ATP-binding protein n=1 Tax=Candidatus Chlorohelix sp. TaxID=3139201 RepID=UPI00302E4A82
MVNGVDGQLAVEIKSLRKSYGKLEALKGINLKVEKGTIFGLLGANGAGKSTMIRILVGSSDASSGEVKVLGLSPFRDSHKLRHRIGYMPQLPALYDDLSAFSNVQFFCSAHGIDNPKQRVKKVLEFTSLTARQNDTVIGFSGGMKQRLSLACALVHQPDVLFLDEPTAGVDPKLREQFWKHFRELAQQGKTIFVSTHMMDEAMLCDRLAIMNQGVVLVQDTPKNIMQMGHSQVHVWSGGHEQVFAIEDYRAQLPILLRKFNLDSSVTKIEIEEDTLETIVLKLLKQTTVEESEREANHV